MRLRAAAMEWNEPKKYGPYGELLFFLMQKEPEPLQGKKSVGSLFEADFRFLLLEVLVSDFVLSYSAEKSMKLSDGKLLGSGFAKDVRGPESTLWESVAEVSSEDESLSATSFREDGVCNVALQIIGLYGPVTR